MLSFCISLVELKIFYSLKKVVVTYNLKRMEYKLTVRRMLVVIVVTLKEYQNKKGKR